MEILYWISGILGFTANLPYLRDIVISSKTNTPLKPIRISWFIFTVLDTLIVFNSIANDQSLLEIALPIGYMLGAFLVALFSIPYGSWIDESSGKKGLSAFKNEFIILGISLLGILIWQFGNSNISLIAFCIALVIGAKPIIQRTWNDPGSEPKLPWTMWAIASVISVICLGNPIHWTLTGSLVSLVYLSLNIPMMYALYLKKREIETLVFEESMSVKEGVVCYVYSFQGDESKDLGIIEVMKGFKTPLQKVVGGTKTQEIYMSGKGVLTIIDINGGIAKYHYPDNPNTNIEVSIGECMQWEALENLVFHEICYPPYEDGRFQDIE